MLKWARTHHCPWNEWTCAAAAGDDHLELLIWAREHQYLCNEGAAKNGDLEMLKWARGQQCPSEGKTCAIAAAKNGDLEMLKWARECQCPWDKDTCAQAVRLMTLKC